MALAFDPVRRSSETHSPAHSSGRSSPDQKVDSVFRQVIHSELDRNSPVPSFQGRVLIPQDPEEDLECEEVDAVARCALGASPSRVVNGYALIPENREFRKEDCLAGKSAPLWLSSQIGSGGIGRSVQMTKDIEDKEKKPEEDLERQAKFDETFARFKFELGLGKDDVVNYSISDHSIEIYDRSGVLQGKYDLLDHGLEGNPQNPVKSGGGLKQLLLDRGYIYSDTQIKDLSQELSNLNQKMRTIIEPETGGEISFVFEAGNKGNVKGLVPFLPRFQEGQKVLNPKEKEKFLMNTLKRLDFVKTDSKVIQGKNGAVVVHRHTLKPEGAAALTDIQQAQHLQNIVLGNIEQRKAVLSRNFQAQASRFSPHTALIPTPVEKEQMETLRKEIEALNKVQDEISGKSPEFSSKIRSLQAACSKIESKLPKDITPAEKQQLKNMKKEIAELGAKNQAFRENNTSALNLMLLQLNQEVTIPHQQIRAADGRLVAHSTAQSAKEFLGPMPASQRAYYGVLPNDSHEADVMRNNMVDHVAQAVANGFEALAQSENASKTFLGLGAPKKLELIPENPAHKELRQIGTNMGGLVHDIATIPSSDPSRLRKRDFVKGRAESQFSQESRGLEFLIAAVVHKGEGGIRGFGREEGSVQRVLEQSLAQFKAAPIQGIPPGASVDPAIKSLLP